ncbi:MAG: hypothetical protein RLZZ546_1010, partial [Bacteroidota bacterium]
MKLQVLSVMLILFLLSNEGNTQSVGIGTASPA